MKNYVQPGKTVTFLAPYDVLSGGGCLVGGVFGVAEADALTGAEVELDTEGVFDLPKAASQAWTQGVPVYWDNTAKVCTTTATDNTLIGHAVLAVGAGAGEVVGRVLLAK